MKSDFAKLQRVAGYSFRNLDFLKEALTHRSFAAENALKYDNQRLEFLGDAVLQIILTDELYRRYPEYEEGNLTKLRSAMANQDALSRLARKIGLGEELMLGRGEIECGGRDRDSTLSDAFESLLGAIYLDAGIAVVQEVALKIIREEYPDPQALLRELNPKGTLQEFCQHHFNMTPVYKTTSVHGPDHEPVFEVSVFIGEKFLGSGSAGKRKTAESLAAGNALENIAGQSEPQVEK